MVWCGDRTEISPKMITALKKAHQHEFKECQRRKHPERYCEICGGRKATKQKTWDLHARNCPNHEPRDTRKGRKGKDWAQSITS